MAMDTRPSWDCRTSARVQNVSHDKLAPEVQAALGLDTEHWASLEPARRQGVKIHMPSTPNAPYSILSN
jgi:hypothetical protein